MHRLLQRQLKRHFGDITAIPAEWQSFLTIVDQTYQQTDEDLARLERTLELSSQELLTSNAQLQSLLQSVENQVAERTAELLQTNAELELTLQELSQTQIQLIQTEKMSALGQLVAGIAHEINNPVNFIRGNLIYADRYVRSLLKLIEVYQHHYPQPHAAIKAIMTELDLKFVMQDFDKLLSSMTQGAERIDQIVRSLRNFSRLDESDMKWVQLHEGLESTLLLLEHRLKDKIGDHSIQVIKQYGELPLIECYAGQMNQVFMHVVNNAIDALVDAKKFMMTNVQSMEGATESPSSPSLDEFSQAFQQAPFYDRFRLLDQELPSIWLKTELLGSEKVCISIADNGMGVTKLHKPRVFDPFFTTKPVGEGVGLSLSISYQIVTQQHGGQLECYSIPGMGTEFIITIPIEQQTT